MPKERNKDRQQPFFKKFKGQTYIYYFSFKGSGSIRLNDDADDDLVQKNIKELQFIF